jgi:glycosyltransferase involved in cell wall biosynthesis
MTSSSVTTQRDGGPPRLSIVVNNYNYARFLPEALDSALSQMRATDELVVVDDGSTDRSPQLLAEYERDHGIRLLRQENSGQLRAVRVGIEAARGDVIVLLDSDDYFIDGYLDRLRSLYSEHPDITFVFTKAELGGDSSIGRESMRAMLRRLQLTPGRVGKTKWATLLFHEFVGVPTSGLSLRRPLANRILALPASAESTTVIPPLLSRLLRISRTEQQKSGYTSDGILVRCASIFDAVKYYDDRPGFIYRIHGTNKYANSTRLGRLYLLYKRRKQFVRMVREHFSIAESPTAIGLRDEILSRSFAVSLRRRAIIRSHYCRAILCSEGGLREKTSALAAALGLQRRTGE